MALEKAPVYPPLQVLQLVIVVAHCPVTFVEVDFPAQYLAVHNVREKNHLAAGSPLNHDVLGCPLFQGAEHPIHCLFEAGAVQGLEQIVVCLYLESVENELFQHRHKDQQAVISPLAQQLGRLHPVQMLHLDVQKNHIKAINRIQQGAAIGKTAEVVSGD